MEILSQVHSKRLEEYGYENRNFVVYVSGHPAPRWKTACYRLTQGLV